MLLELLEEELLEEDEVLLEDELEELLVFVDELLLEEDELADELAEVAELEDLLPAETKTQSEPLLT